MRFLLDLQVLQAESRDRGIGRYSRGLADALLSITDSHETSVLLNLAITEGLAQRAKNTRGKNVGTKRNYWREFDHLREWIANRRPAIDVSVFSGLTNIAGMLSNWERAGACEALYDGYVNSRHVDLIHIPSPFEGFGDDAIVGWTDMSRAGPVRAATVYDLIPFEQPETYLPEPVGERWYRRRLAGLQQADLLVTISEYTRTVALNLLNLPADRVVSIGTDTDPEFRRREFSPEQKADLLQKYGITKPFIMHVGILEARKNVPALVRAFAALSPEIRASHQLVLVAEATPKQVMELRQLAEQCGLEHNAMLFPGFVPDHDLVGLYSLTSALVMPSISEGFGLPVLEAMRCGAPVLASDSTSLPEVVGNRDLLFDPSQPTALAGKLALVLTDEGFRRYALEHGAQQEKKYSWKGIAERARQAFAEAVKRPRVNTHPPRTRSQYILVPPATPDPSDRDRIKAVVTALETSGDIFLPAEAEGASGGNSAIEYGRLNLDDLAPSYQQRVLLLPNPAGLDAQHERILSRVPGLIVASGLPPDKPPAPEWRYRAEGYNTLSATADAVQQSPIDVVLNAYSQVIGVINPPLNTNLAEEIETLYRSHPASTIVEIISQLSPLDLVSCADVAAALAENHAVEPRRPRLLVDVSRLIHYDAKSGIQRVVKNTLKALLSRRCDLRVEPVYRDGDVYRYARRFTCDFLNVSPLNLKDGIVDFHPSDTFLGLDLDIEITEGASAALRTLRSRGGTVNFVVYDLLVLTRPVSFSDSTITAFHNWFQRTIDAATRFIAISRTVADDLYAMLADTNRNRSEIQVSWYHLGTDLGGDETHHSGATGERAKLLSHSAARTSFLTVGTIEPRKGIAQLLDAAEDVWRDHDVVFMLAGNGGWLVDDLINRIKKHPQLNKRLFWFGQVTDDLLLDLYRTATAVVLPSEAEGFGLPLIEAAQLNIPVIARDIPVFREVGGEGAYYFHGQSGAELASSLRDWLEQYQGHTIPDPRRVGVLDWAQSTDQLLAAAQGNRPYRVWRNAD